MFDENKNLKLRIVQLENEVRRLAYSRDEARVEIAAYKQTVDLLMAHLNLEKHTTPSTPAVTKLRKRKKQKASKVSASANMQSPQVNSYNVGFSSGLVSRYVTASGNQWV